MKIAINTFALSVKRGMGGPGRYQLGLVNGLSRLVHPHSIYLLCNNDNASLLPDSPGFIKVICGRWTESAATRILWEHCILPFVVRRLGIDVLHSTNFVAPVYVPCSSVVTLHDMTWFLQAELHIAAKRFYFQKLIPFSARQSQQVIADSESTRRDIVNLLGIPDDRVRVVYLGIETQRFHPVEDDDWKAKIEKRYGVGSKTYILYVGGIHPRKNIISLVKAFSLLKKRGFSEKLVLAGGLLFGNTELLEALKRLSLNNDVVLAGQVPDDDLPALYSNASVLAYPSLYEGFGFPVLEGMACGTPVVTSDASSLPEVAGEAGMLADPNSVEDISEKLSAVLSNPELSSHMRNRGFEQARKFSWELTAKQTLAVYEQAFRSWKDGSSR